jgi:2-phospho-L-lactate transferase
MARELPAGTVTFLFTDIEGSTRLLDELGPTEYARALASHRRLLREAFSANEGVEVDTQGDAFFVAFGSAAAAVRAAEQATVALANGRIRVRIGIHTGAPLVTPEGYVGPDVHRAARIAAAGHGGQVLLSKETRDQVTGAFTDLGEHRLKDFATPAWIFQLGADSFPPLSTISNTNVPRQSTTFLGRDRELSEIADRVHDATHLLTLTGPAGSGKTRLAMEAARRLVPDFKAGVFWVDLTPVGEPNLVADAIARTLGATQELGQHIAERQLLLVLDNFEHVIGAAPILTKLVERCANLRVLVTSRERLSVRGEQSVEVEPLAERHAVQLFADRSGVTPDAAVVELCEALDNLPLAVELAAARASVLSPSQMLERISQRLDLLKAGRDTDARHHSLRAAIEWSHELLMPSEQLLLAAMSVFAGGCTLEAAEKVASAQLDDLQSLVDKSLVRRQGKRFDMLESIRALAQEKLATDLRAGIRGRHADFYNAFAQSQHAILQAGDPEEGPVAALEEEIHNLRAAVDFGLETGRVSMVREITAALDMYWIMRGYHAEARAWLDRAVTLSDKRDLTRRRLLSALATIAYAQNDHQVAVEAADAAAELATELGGVSEELVLIRTRAQAAIAEGDYDTAETLLRRRVELAAAAGNGVSTSASRLNLAYLANKTGRHQQAEELLTENLTFVRSKGQTRCEAYTLAGLANRQTGWGVTDESWSASAMLERYGAQTWFRLGDRDLATHIRRTKLLRAGQRLTDVTAQLSTALGIRARLLPMTDDQVRTRVRTPDGWLDFQDYFVRRGHRDRVVELDLRGIDRARPTPEVIQAIESTDVIVIAPSNPFVSVGPILALPTLAERLLATRAPVLAVSPIVAGAALRGPARDMLESLGAEPTAAGLARHYASHHPGLIDMFVIDRTDAQEAGEITAAGMRPVVLDIVMADEPDRRRLAGEQLALARSPGSADRA